jgi:hypothetical protein
MNASGPDCGYRKNRSSPVETLSLANPAAIAAFATLLAAVVSGTFAIVTALVNQWASRRLARDEQLRGIRSNILLPAVIPLDEWIEGYHGTLLRDRLAADVRSLIVSAPDVPISRHAQTFGLATLVATYKKARIMAIERTSAPEDQADDEWCHCALRQLYVLGMMLTNEVNDFALLGRTSTRRTVIKRLKKLFQNLPFVLVDPEKPGLRMVSDKRMPA